LLTFLGNDQPAWRDEDHPELKSGTAAWVRALRAEERGAGSKKPDGKPVRKSR
jgi:hypothetical protein